MSLAPGEKTRTSVNFTLPDGTLYQNVFTHEYSGIITYNDAPIVAALASWAETMYGEITAAVDDDTDPALSTVDKIAFVGGEWVIAANMGTFLISFIPTNAVDPLPNQVAPYVVQKTARPRTVGKKYLFPFTEDQYTQGVLGAAAVADMVAWADDAINNIFLDILEELVPGVVRVGVDAFWEFTVAVITNIAGTQRRRRRGVGA